ncbi:nicotianamine synthase 3-like [Phoenix dactylifera]|uniref:Nicotianamine synthase n=1 Tax=Phoenix dactylifera TaxID=42345 RepID=A0A8B7BK78_PHODC|nr:nicotianamine synthase 3-like [Phoenix dactylifera]
MGFQEEKLVEKISEIHENISNLPSLSPSKEVNTLFTKLVLTCIPPSPIDVSKLSKDAQEMRSKLIQLCGEAEGLLESHYSDILANTYDNPIDHLALFPYYSNYLQLSLLEHTLLARHATSPPARVAFVGSGPLPLSSLVLAARHMRAARFHNYDVDPSATTRARRLVRADPDLGARLAFLTADLFGLTRELAGHDVVFLAALVGVEREEKLRAVEHLARHMAPGAYLVLRSAHGARAFLYPVVEPGDLKGFEVLSVYHPSDEVINSVIIARKLTQGGVGTGAVMRTCKCCEMMQGINHLGGHGAMMEEMALEELPS